MAITYTKLKSGEWGIRVSGETVREGQTVTVTKKDGNRDAKVVKKILWSGGGVQLCAVEGGSSGSSYTPRAGRSSDKRMTGRCWECGGPMPQWLADRGDECGNC